MNTFAADVAEMKSYDPSIFRSEVPFTVEAASIGDVVRQGDIYLTCLESLPKGKETQERQLAPGTTQGSRHVLDGDCEIVTVNTFKSFNPVLIGPAFKCVGNVEVTHPEHKNVILPQGTCWQVTYQQVHAEEVRRVQD
jgi:hypothetical protein